MTEFNVEEIFNQLVNKKVKLHRELDAMEIEALSLPNKKRKEAFSRIAKIRKDLIK